MAAAKQPTLNFSKSKARAEAEGSEYSVEVRGEEKVAAAAKQPTLNFSKSKARAEAEWKRIFR